jgi:hypothetical protein
MGSRVRTARLYNRIMARLRSEDGYQPYGYDMPTLNTTRPGIAQAIRDIASAHNSLPKVSP